MGGGGGRGGVQGGCSGDLSWDSRFRMVSEAIFSAYPWDSGSFQARRVGFQWMASGKVRYIHFLILRKKMFIERRRRHFEGILGA